MRVQQFTGGDFAQNGYLVTGGDEESAVVVDPGEAAPRMVRSLREEGREVAAILLTHAHLDHVEGVGVVRAAFDAPIHLHPADRPLYDAAPEQARAYQRSLDPPPPPPDRELKGGEELELSGLRFQVRHAPGHSPGHVIFLDGEGDLALVGDVVFQGSIGRTDLPGGDFQQLMSSIRQQVLTLPDSTRLLPGHGPETTVGHERRGNPFLTSHFGGELA